MSKKANYAVVLLFVLFLALAFSLNLFLPDTAFSEKENRYLQMFPTFSIPALLRGEYTPKMESYCADQFMARDEWIGLKARLELLQGKKENNGVYLCQDERLIEPLVIPDQGRMDQQIGYVNALAKNVYVPVTLGLIPTCAELYGGLLPSGVRNDSQRAAIEYIYSRTNTANADILDALAAHRDDYIYYRTDHHWTSLGARWGYWALTKALDLEECTTFSEQIVSRDFYGTAYSSSGFFWVEPDSIHTLVDEPADVVIERYETTEPESGELYVESMLNTKDKYRFFLGGNTPRAVVRTGKEALPSLLIVRDSFADSLVPFLLAHYSTIHLLDLRYYRGSMAEYIQENKIDSVLILYSTETFLTENNLALLTR